MYDEELPMKYIFDKILMDTPDNIKIQVENEWLTFSQSTDKFDFYTQLFIEYNHQKY